MTCDVCVKKIDVQMKNKNDVCKKDNKLITDLYQVLGPGEEHVSPKYLLEASRK